VLARLYADGLYACGVVLCCAVLRCAVRCVLCAVLYFSPLAECTSNPCVNGGTCSDLENAYLCACVAGFTGVRCETNVNECASNPCQNQATCVDGTVRTGEGGVWDGVCVG
jgi:hypothetical protein